MTFAETKSKRKSQQTSNTLLRTGRYRALLMIGAGVLAAFTGVLKAQFIAPPEPGHTVASGGDSSEPSTRRPSSPGPSNGETKAQREAREVRHRGVMSSQRGDASRKRGRLNEAVQFYEQALQDIPDNQYLKDWLSWCRTKILLNRAEAAFQRGDYEQTIALWEQVYESHLENVQLERNIRALRADLIENEGAKAWNDEIGKDIADTAVLEKAIESWKKAREIYPENKSGYDVQIAKCEKTLQETIEKEKRDAEIAAAAQGNLDHVKNVLGNNNSAATIWLPNPADVATEISQRTPATYEQARRNVTALKSLKKDLEDELGKVRGWKGGLEKDQAEFEKIRSEAQRDFANDVVMHIPASEAFDTLSKRKYLTPATANSLKQALHAVQGLIAGREGVAIEGSSNKDDTERLSKITEAEKQLRAAIRDHAADNLIKQEAKDWLANMDKFLDVVIQTASFGQQKDHSWSAVGQLF